MKMIQIVGLNNEPSTKKSCMLYTAGTGGSDKIYHTTCDVCRRGLHIIN